MKVTVFPSITSTGSPQYTDAKSILALIQSGGKKKGFIESIRKLPVAEYKKQKNSLPVICWGGCFTQRNKESISEGSGLLVLDFDNVKDLNSLRKELLGDPHVYAVFLSPSGRGYKALIRIPITKSDAEYKKYFAALKKVWKTADPSGKDIVRSCYFSYDNDLYINDRAEVWDKQYEPPKDRKESPYQVKSGAWDGIHKALRKIEDSMDGEKHDVRTKVAYLFGGWVASGELRYEDAYKLLEQAVLKNTTDPRMAMKDIKDALVAGQSKPLNMTEQRRVLEMEVGLGRKYNAMSEVWDEVTSFYKNGYRRGSDVGWKSALDYVTVLKGTTSYIYGSPFSGKSQWWHEVLINIIQKESENGVDEYAMILSPETGSVPQIFGELISIKARQTFVGDFKMSESEMMEAADFIAKHFLVLDFDGVGATMKDVFVQVEAAEREFGIKIGYVTVDPLNYLITDESKFSRRDIAISKDLDFLLADARKNNRHNTIITHSANQQIQKTKDGQWYYPVVSPREILDGQQFFRKGLLMISIYRPLDVKGEPLFSEDGTPYKKNETHIYIQKAKPKGTSNIGMFKLFYDFKKNRYYEENMFTGGKMYAFDHEKKKERKVELVSNTEFDNKVVEEETEQDCPF